MLSQWGLIHFCLRSHARCLQAVATACQHELVLMLACAGRPKLMGPTGYLPIGSLRNVSLGYPISFYDEPWHLSEQDGQAVAGWTWLGKDGAPACRVVEGAAERLHAARRHPEGTAPVGVLDNLAVNFFRIVWPRHLPRHLAEGAPVF